MNNSILERKKCCICNIDSTNLIHTWNKNKYSHEFYETCSWDGRQKISLKIVICNQCGLKYSKPSFKEESLNFVYPNDIINKKENDVDDIFNLNDNKFNSILKIIIKYVKSGYLLDVGTRYGVLPWIANKRYNFSSYGIEYNLKSVKFGRKKFKNIFCATIPDLNKILLKNNISSFNAIILDDVLEHLVHPLRDLKILSKCQKKGDYIFLRQMNYNSLGRYLFNDSWYYFAPAAHQYYFDENSIKNLLEKAGYDLIKIHKINLFKNLILTLLLYLKNMNKIYERFFLKPKSEIISNYKKKSYLSKRYKSYDDMFLVVARKK